MKVIVNGKLKVLRSGATLKSAIVGEPYINDTQISIYLSQETITKKTNEFEIVTDYGIMVMHLNDSIYAEMWRTKLIHNMIGIKTKWVTHDIIAFGSFPSDISLDRSANFYKTYDCFLSLGGFDNKTTYFMIAQNNHIGSYGAGNAVIGRIVIGRHLLSNIHEGDHISDIRPLTSEINKDNIIMTKDLSFKLEDGYKIETNVSIDLDPRSPQSAEHVLILSSNGYLKVTESTGSFVSCSDGVDISTLAKEEIKTRVQGAVTIRNSGLGNKRLYIYKDRRQMSLSHNFAGQVTNGTNILMKIKENEKFTVTTNPNRVLSIGMSQLDGYNFLCGSGIKQIRIGDYDDSAIIVKQKPEYTMIALDTKSVETYGIPKEKVYKIQLLDEDPISSQYFRKITGLDHKSIGALKVQFTFKGLPIITFYGDEIRGKNLYPQNHFKIAKRGDIGITNQARPHHGLIGIRLEDSREYGPTGEEPYGTNIVGKFIGDIDKLMDGISENDTIYITEREL